jgi:cysteine-rich repeat protein
MRAPLSAVAAAILSLALVRPAHAWRTDVAGTPHPSRPSDVTTLADGTVVAAGRIGADGTPDDGIVVALDPATGEERWRHLDTGTDLTANDIYRRVLPGPDDTVIAAARVTDLDTGTDALIVRLAADDGALLWESLRDGGEGLTDDVQDVAVLDSGDVVAVGRLESGIDFGSMAVWRLDAATGAVLWTTRLDVPTGVGRRIAVAGDAAYVIGDTDATGIDDDVVIARLALADGAVAWTTTVGGDAGTNDDPIGVAVAGDQVTVLADVVQTATGPDGLVLALGASDGAERWRTLLDGAATGSADADAFSAVALAPNGDAIVTGSVTNPDTGNDLLVARLAAADGAVLWRTERDGGNDAGDEGRGIAVATLGTADGAFVTGRLREPGVGGEIAALRLDAATGAVRWQRAIEGGADRNDVGLAIALDTQGNVVIGARTRQDNAGDEFTVLKLSAASGGSFPCGNGVVDPGEECDDANRTRGDGCRPDCTVEACGDGILDPQEACDEPGSPCCVGCAFPPADTPCDDGDACTQTDRCIAGECVGDDPVVCSPPAPCKTFACDTGSGLCVATLRPDATSCSDGDACTRSDQCRAGTCVGGVPEVCDDFEPCTVDDCDPATGCTFTPYEGIASVTCAVDAARVGQQCGTDVPSSIARRITKIGVLLERADVATGRRRVRRLLRKVTKLAHRAGGKSARLRDHDRLPVVCGETLVRVLADIEARARLLREAT